MVQDRGRGGSHAVLAKRKSTDEDGDMILGFKPCFVAPILAGTKIHTIREDKHDRWHNGQIIHFATGIRTQKYEQFYSGVCISTQKIIIEHDVHAIGDTVVVIDERVLPLEETEMLSKNDGFVIHAEFEAWFNKDFIGKIIQWTPYRY